MLHLCLCFTDSSGTYYKHALVSLVSVFEHTQSHICAHIISDGTFTEDKKEIFIAACEKYNQKLQFHSLEDIPETIYRNIPKNFGKGSLFRLFIPEVIQEEKVLYIDCDIICQLDVKDVFNINIDDACIGAVLDSAVEDEELSFGYVEKIGIEPSHYINSGILLLNNKRLRGEFPDLKDAVLSIVSQVTLRFPDQDALNYLFPLRSGSLIPPLSRKRYRERLFEKTKYRACKTHQTESIRKRNGKIFLMPAEYNYPTWPMERGYYPLSHYKNKIIHFTCKKPWTALYPAALLYWKHYFQLFPMEEAFDTLEGLELHKFTPLFHLLMKDEKARRWFSRLHEISSQGLIETVMDRLIPSRRRNKRQTVQSYKKYL